MTTPPAPAVPEPPAAHRPPEPPSAPAPLTWLYVPGDRPDTVAKALRSGADTVIVDLEDAVRPDRKEYARAATAELLTERPPVPVHVRVNALDGPLAGPDIRALAGLPGLGGLRLPKVDSATTVVRVAELSDATPLFALLESALGIERAYRIASAHPALHGIAIGETDLRAELGLDPPADPAGAADTGLDWARGRTVCAARAAGLPPPAQSVHPDVRDLEGLAASCARGRALGFLGRAAIHPRQLPVIEAAYRPTPAQLAAAREIVAADGEGAVALPDGRFVDTAVVAAARRVLGRARE
ncbi:(3S)-malyl-CoA thioesterase [Streptomyces sp. YIM 130001]|uniref:HpcH/HpaI aldolase/citrate lyase family protein n=1 Tax=Streptomyces sp. YIM 130001 TaxID=2259644 RepID=UPI000E65CBD7|nr:CoA ester lyase [Streptomyces sp. YIM 130001]RII18346.1 (3S)-malyl-CoA thioesterase [Streptomyces sp. YIM 130001]